MPSSEIEFAEGKARINRKLDAVREVVLAVASTGQLDGMRMGRYRFGADLFLITRDEEGEIFTAEAKYHPNRRAHGRKIQITGYGTYLLGEDKWKDANEAVDYTSSTLSSQKVLCDGSILDEFLRENLALDVGNNRFVLQRPYGLVQIYSSVPPTVRPNVGSYYGDW